MKITKEQAQKLAIHLFELEIDSMQNNMDDFYIDLIGWFNVFGDKAKELFEATTSDPKNEFNARAIETISNLLVDDFEDGYWTIKSEDGFGGLYHHMMISQYGGIINDAITKQMLINSGVGIQLNLHMSI
jgi:hypothetical protein